MADHGKTSESSLAQLLKSRLSLQDMDDLKRMFGRKADVSLAEPEESYAAAFDAVLPVLVDTHVSEANANSADLFAELMQHSPDRQTFLLKNSRRFHRARLVDLLAERSSDASFDDPGNGVHLAGLAVEIAESLRQDTPALNEALLNDLEGKAKVAQANALRTFGKLRDAERALAEAESSLEVGSGDLLLLAQCHFVRGALSGNLGNYAACFQSFDQAIRIYSQCGEDQDRSRLMVHKALFYGYAGEIEKAIDLLRDGIKLADAHENPRLLVSAHHNLILFLTDQKRIEEAKARLEAIRPTYHQLGDETTLLRLRWLEGRIAHASKDFAAAEGAFEEARAAFAAKDIVWDAALVSLELASLYAEQDRTAEIQSLANEIIPLFKATGQQREALATLILFKKAAEMEKVSEQLIRATVAQLRSLRRDR